MGAEAAMGQHAMVADGQAEGIERVHRYQQCQVGPLDGLLPKQCDCQNSSEERNGHNYKNKRFCVAQRFHEISTGVVASAKSRDMLGKGGAGVSPWFPLFPKRFVENALVAGRVRESKKVTALV